MNVRSACLLFACCLAAVAGGTTAGQDKPKTEKAPLKVEIAQPIVREVVDYENFTGRTEAAQSVEIRARVTGYLEKVSFRDGEKVKKGDLLFEIDPRPYQSEATRAEAEVAKAGARLKRATAELERAKKLKDGKTIGEDEFNRIQGDQEVAAAELAAARATLEAAKINLTFTKVTAPISGRIGRRMLDPGNLVKADETALATIVSLDPIYVSFDLDERSYLDLRKAAREGKFKESGAPIQLALANEEGFPHQGKVDFVDNHADPNTGTIRVRALFPNADGVLLPGLFARARLSVSEPYKAVLVPETALGSANGQRYLFVVNEKNVIERRPVKLQQRYDNSRVVKEGLKAGEWVIVKGLEDVREGQTVEPKKVDLSPRDK
jgi:RND family efflux transporter MFP subunit